MLRWTIGSVDQHGPAASPLARPAARRLPGVRSVYHSGPALRLGCRAKMLELPRAFRRRSAHAGSERQAGCHQRCSGHRPSLCRAVICRWKSARRLRSCGRRTARCRGSHVNWGGPHRRSPANCAGTPQHAMAGWIIGRRRHNGMPSDRHVGPSLASCSATMRFATMCRNVSPALS